MSPEETNARESWLASRRLDNGRVLLGGSDAAAIMGYMGKSALDVYNEKVGNSSRKQSGPMKAGIMLEDAIRNWYHHDTGRCRVDPHYIANFIKYGHSEPPEAIVAALGEVAAQELCELRCSVWYQKKGHKDVTFRSLDKPWAIATPDGFELRDGHLSITEIKNVADFKKADWEAQIPEGLLAQGDHYLSTFGLKHLTLVALFGGNELGWYEITADQGRINKLMGLESLFVEAFDSGEVPDLGASLQAVKDLYCNPDEQKVIDMRDITVQFGDEVVRMTPSVFDMKWCELKRSVSDSNAMLKAMEKSFRICAQDAGVVRFTNGAQYRIKKIQRDGYTVKPSSYTTIRRSAKGKGE